MFVKKGFIMLKDLLSALYAIKDNTRLGLLIRSGQDFEPQNDEEYHAKYLYCELLKNFFDNKYSAYITAETIKQILDEKGEIYNPQKIPRVAMYLRNKLRPAQPLTDDWIVWFVRRFR